MYPLESLCGFRHGKTLHSLYSECSLYMLFSITVPLVLSEELLSKEQHQLQWLSSHRHNTSLLTFMFSFHATLVFGY